MTDAAEIKLLAETAAVTYSLYCKRRAKESRGGLRASADESNAAMAALHAAIDAQAAAAQALQARAEAAEAQLAAERMALRVVIDECQREIADLRMQREALRMQARRNAHKPPARTGSTS